MMITLRVHRKGKMIYLSRLKTILRVLEEKYLLAIWAVRRPLTATSNFFNPINSVELT